MRRLLWVATVLILSGVVVPLRAQEDPKNLLITEVYVASTDDSKAEFIELYNPNDFPIELIDWEIQYKSATGENWQTKFIFEDSQAQPQGFVLLVTEELGLSEDEYDGLFNSGLAVSSGHVRIVQPVEVKDELGELIDEEFIHDTLGYGDAADGPEGFSAPSPEVSQSLKRLVDEDGLFIDTNDNSLDFEISDTPTPTRTLSVEETEETIQPEEDPEENPGTGNDNVEYLQVEITELFIDPKSPQTDADDEFVELFNPNSQPVNLDGYIIQTGSKLQYRFEITDIVLKPKSYISFESRDSGLVLANSGGKAQVLAPDGSIAAELIAYEKAPSGQSWSKFSSGFAFTNRVTPGEANKPSLTEPTTTNTKTESKVTKKSYPKVIITEVLPNPASPLLDKNDEYVEFYNPNTFAVNLEGYKLKTGKSLSTSQTLENIVLQPGQYVAVFSADSKMSLGNSGGSAHLQDPNGLVVSRISEYGKAEDGLSWALVSGKWQWTAKPTPAAKNVVQSLEQKQASRQEESDSALTIQAQSGNPLAQPAAIPIESANMSVVAAAGVATLFYGLYEFRHDISNSFYRARTYVSNRRKDS